MTPEDIDNRFKHHPPKDLATVKAHEAVRDGCRVTAELLNTLVPEGREKALAITKLEEVMMWANAGIARNPHNDKDVP